MLRRQTNHCHYVKGIMKRNQTDQHFHETIPCHFLIKNEDHLFYSWGYWKMIKVAMEKKIPKNVSTVVLKNNFWGRGMWQIKPKYFGEHYLWYLSIDWPPPPNQPPLSRIRACAEPKCISRSWVQASGFVEWCYAVLITTTPRPWEM